MKVVCIKKYWNHKLTLNKIYTVSCNARGVESFSSNDSDSYLIRDDLGQPIWCNDDVLIPIQKYRESRLKEIGI